MATTIEIDAEFRELIPPLRLDERSGLEESLKTQGCRDALVVWRNGKDTLLDGHNRYEICQANGIAFQIKPIELADRAYAKLWIEENQLARRNLSDDQRAMVADAVRERRSKLRIEKRASEAGQTGGRNHPKVSLSVNPSDKLTPHRDTRAEVARENHLPERKLRAAAEVKKQSPALARKVLEGTPIEDRDHNTDLTLSNIATAIRVACRIRDIRYIKAYGDEFTIRAVREKNRTELVKIMDGWGSHICYGFTDGARLIRAGLGDLDIFRKFWLDKWQKPDQSGSLIPIPAGTFPGKLRHNGDGSSDFYAYKWRDLPTEFVVAANWDVHNLGWARK